MRGSSALLLCLGLQVLFTTLVGASVSAVWGLTLGYDRNRRARAMKAPKSLMHRVHRAHASASEWAPLFCALFLASGATSWGNQKAGGEPPDDVVAAAAIGTAGLVMHKLGLLSLSPPFAIFVVGFVSQTLGLLYLASRLIAQHLL